MERAEIKQIADYIKDLRERLSNEGHDHISMQTELPYLYQVIRLFMDATFESKDKGLKVLLATLELQARKCKEFIEEKLAVKN